MGGFVLLRKRRGGSTAKDAVPAEAAPPASNKKSRREPDATSASPAKIPPQDQHQALLSSPFPHSRPLPAAHPSPQTAGPHTIEDGRPIPCSTPPQAAPPSPEPNASKPPPATPLHPTQSPQLAHTTGDDELHAHSEDEQPEDAPRSPLPPLRLLESCQAQLESLPAECPSALALQWLLQHAILALACRQDAEPEVSVTLPACPTTTTQPSAADGAAVTQAAAAAATSETAAVVSAEVGPHLDSSSARTQAPTTAVCSTSLTAAALSISDVLGRLLRRTAEDAAVLATVGASGSTADAPAAPATAAALPGAANANTAVQTLFSIPSMLPGSNTSASEPQLESSTDALREGGLSAPACGSTELSSEAGTGSFDSLPPMVRQLAHGEEIAQALRTRLQELETEEAEWLLLQQRYGLLHSGVQSLGEEGPAAVAQAAAGLAAAVQAAAAAPGAGATLRQLSVGGSDSQGETLAGTGVGADSVTDATASMPPSATATTEAAVLSTPKRGVLAAGVAAATAGGAAITAVELLLQSAQQQQQQAAQQPGAELHAQRAATRASIVVAVEAACCMLTKIGAQVEEAETVCSLVQVCESHDKHLIKIGLTLMVCSLSPLCK